MAGAAAGGEYPSDPREHIETIRRDRFFIGRDEKNPLAEDMHQAVNYLSAELYAKDVHFLMELVQNAEDNEYPAGVDPSLEFVITSRDITATGATATLLVFNNEKGFSPANIQSICRIGKSTKKGNRQRGYIGEKGIGFKSVFLITSKPYIFSNGYQIRFNEEPSPECDVGYIVPEWVDKNPVLSDIQQIYGSAETLPTTTIILPLKHEKVVPVKQQLSNVHPELLLFLSKIRHLSVREDNANPNLNTIKEVSISSEIDFQRRKNMDAESYTLHLSVQEDGDGGEGECSYYMWRQRFPVKSDCRVEKRMEVEEWAVTLAFPFGNRLSRGMKSSGVYAFLPTEMVTKFPFIIQADFILVSSRESISLDNKWNKGILDCVAPAFINAFVSLLKSTENPPSFSLPPYFRFLPVHSSPFPLLDSVRDSIKERVVAEHIIPCESYTSQRFFCRPSEVGRLMPAFWSILLDVQKIGINLQNLSSHGTYILSSSFDTEEYADVLEFLGVGYVENSWYAKCVEGSNLALQATDEVYLDLLCFFADNWWSHFSNTSVPNIPLLKYVDLKGRVSLWSINRATKFSERICLQSHKHDISWLNDWNQEFGSVTDWFFIPRSTHTALESFQKRAAIKEWLRQCASVQAVSVYDYSWRLLRNLNGNAELVIAFTHFLYHSLSEKHLTEWEASQLCQSLPLVDNYGRVTSKGSVVLVPAKGSKWLQLMGSNPWRSEGYIELGLDYLSSGSFAGVYTSEAELLQFLRTHINASDVPHIPPPNATFPTVSSSLTRENTFLLLEWVRNLRFQGTRIPDRFLQCIRIGRWLRTSIGDSAPSESFFSSSEWGNLLQVGSLLVDIPLIDQEFYGPHISNYKEELKTLGVMFEYGEACHFIGKRLMSMTATSNLTRSNVYTMLKFIRFLQHKYLSPEEFVSSVKEGRWLKTSHGYRCPVGSVLFDDGWKCASFISNPPFIDENYYGKDIILYEVELKLLGVIVGFNQNYQLVVDNLRPNATLSSMTADTILFILDCLRHVRSTSTNCLIRKLKEEKWVKTNVGCKLPSESILFLPEWECLLKVVDGVPIIDRDFYGNRIMSYQEELKQTGVMIGLEQMSKAVAHRFKQLVTSSSVAKENVFGLLSCYRHLKEKFPLELMTCIRKEKWLKTLMGYRSPSKSILFDRNWVPIFSIAFLPFIDDREGCYGKEIHEYSDELKALGVVVDFEQGSRFVAAGLHIPEDPTELTPASVLSLLKCIRNLKKSMADLPSSKEFTRSIKRKWVKTRRGYQSPEESLLYDSKWGSFLQPEDGPFIVDEFYGSEIASYCEELKQIGVVVDVTKGCALMASHLLEHSHKPTIVRIYKYLHESNWVPENKDGNWIWIPSGDDTGEWVSPNSCVLHDRDNLFSSELHILDKHYEHKLLGFFSVALGVRHGPAMADYCTLWQEWEQQQQQQQVRLAYEDCCAFWVYVARHWNPSTVGLLSGSITKLPVSTQAGIVLRSKQDVFIPDDLLLKDLFDEASQGSLSVWCPRRDEPALPQPKLYEIYRGIGARTLTEAVEHELSSLPKPDCTKKADAGQSLLKRGLFRILLGFLADPSLDLSTEKRHRLVQSICDVEVLEADEPITARYSLQLSSGEAIRVEASRMFRLEREKSRLFVQKLDWASGQRPSMEFATYYSEVMSKGVLWEKPDRAGGLAELLRLGCLVDFDEGAVNFLLKTKNLQLFLEDEEFLSSKFPSG
uniref:Sacsin n=1 Tax=Anthurium amnicola TaxID=1678845 RepID=A0A1D1XGE7_9ARAE